MEFATDKTDDFDPAPLPGIYDQWRGADQAQTMREAARSGLAGTAQAFPFSQEIRSGFGRYAPQGLRAFSGAKTQKAACALDAHAFALGRDVGFAGPPTLQHAAHEAAHVVAADHGLGVPHNVGAAGDAHEALADAAAHAVTTGQSAEPIFQAALGNAGPQSTADSLHMINTVTSHTSKKKDTPWKQIKDKLPLKATVDMRDKVTNLGSSFGVMYDTLGDNTDRAEEVKASLDGSRPGGLRKNDTTQTAYGNIGNFLSEITGSTQHASFQGGHLVADQLLGKDSYSPWNFAPQSAALNSPYYRVIEEIAEDGAYKRVSGGMEKVKPITYEAEVTYDKDDFDVDPTTVTAALGITAADLTGPLPATLSLTTWVPNLWKTSVSAPAGSYFEKEQSAVQGGTSGRDAGFYGTESDVEKLATTTPPGSSKLYTSKYHDVNKFGMDQMKYDVGGGALGTASVASRQNKFTWTGVQSPPYGQTKAFNTAKGPTIPKTPLPHPKLPMAIGPTDISDVLDTSKTAGAAKAQGAGFYDAASSKFDGFGKGQYELMFQSMQAAFHGGNTKTSGGKTVGYLGDARSYLRKKQTQSSRQKRGRNDTLFDEFYESLTHPAKKRFYE